MLKTFLASFLIAASLVATAIAKEADKKAPAPAAADGAAPALKLGKFFKGKAIDKLDPKNVYVIECWATWCGPCKAAIPHVTELAHAYKDVTFVGVAVWEKGADKEIAAFVKGMGNKMDYNVCRSTKDFEEKWLQANGVKGIPHAFIVKDNKIVAHVHPGSLEAELEKIGCKKTAK
jgi:thiol-disulfide isomerase/thioredoxin